VNFPAGTKNVFVTLPAEAALTNSPNLDGGVPSTNYGGAQAIDGGSP
jgi:hypothetical protein